MQRRTAVIFAGVDALDVEEHRFSVFSIPEVRQQVLQAEEILEGLGEKPGLLQGILHSRDSEYFSLDLLSRVPACIAVQTGLYNKYIKSNPAPDFFAACSLGDSARLVASGAASFEEVITGSYTFASAAKKIQNGIIVRVRAKIPMAQNDFSFLEHFGLSVAVFQTPRHFLVAGQVSDLQKWAAVGDPRIDQIIPLYSYPLHSKFMKPAYEEVFPLVQSQRERTWSGELISSALKKVIHTMEDLRTDVEANMIGTVHWSQTFQWMVNDLGVDQFVNIGPAPTLLLFAARTPVKQYPVFKSGLKFETVNPYKKQDAVIRQAKPPVSANMSHGCEG